MCFIWKTITHILRKLKQLKIQQMIEGLPKDAGLRSVEKSAWEWGPKLGEKNMTASNTSSFCLFPWHLLQRPTEGKVTPCQQWCSWVPVQRASICQVGQFQHSTHHRLACVLLFKATYLCTRLCTRCVPRCNSVSVYFLSTRREVAPLV